MWRRSIALFLTVVALLIPQTSFSQDLVPAQHVSLVLVIDSSGSMAKTDPTYLRITSAKLLVSLLDINDEVGLVEFGTDVTLAIDLVKIQTDSDKNSIYGNLDKIVTLDYASTDMAEALEWAGDIIYEANPNNDRYIVLLTDGEPDSAPLAKEKASTLGVPVLCIGLGLRDAAQAFLEELANLTGGRVFDADNANDLSDTYLSVLGQLKDRNIAISEQEAGDANLLRLIKIDPATGEYILNVGPALLGVTFALIQSGVDCKSNECLAITKPGGIVLSAKDPGVEHWAEKDFAVVSIAYPVEGKWRVRVVYPQPANLRAILKSRLRMRLVSPAQFLQPAGKGLELVAQLYRESDAGELEKIVGEPERLVTVEIQRTGTIELGDAIDLYDDGSHGDKVTGDGDFTNIYPNTGIPGEYTLRLETIEQGIPVHFVPPPIQIEEFPISVLTSHMPNQVVTVALGEPLEFTAGMELAEAELLSAWAEVTRSDGKPVPRVDMPVTAGLASGNFKPEMPSTTVTIVVYATANYKGVLYEAASPSVSIVVNIQPLLRHDLTLTADFGAGYTLKELQPVSFTACALSSQAVQLSAQVIGLPWLRVRVEPPILSPGIETPVTIYPELAEGQGVLQPGQYDGTLLLETVPAMVMAPSFSIPLRLELIQPQLSHTLNTTTNFGAGFSLQELKPVTFEARLFGSQPVRPSAQITGLSWLQVRVEPLVLSPGVVTRMDLYAELKPGQELPAAGHVYTGTLVLKTEPEVAVEPLAELPLTLELLQPGINHTLPRAEFGTIANLSQLPQLSPIDFVVYSSLPSPASLEAHLIGPDGKENKRVRLVLTPDEVPERDRTQVQLSLKPVGSPGGPPLLVGRTLEGTVVISATTAEGLNLTVQPRQDRVPFHLHECSRLSGIIEGLGQACLLILVILVILVSAYFVAMVIWGGLRYWSGSLPAGMVLQQVEERNGVFVEADDYSPLSNYRKLRHRLFGIVLTAAQDHGTPVYYEDDIGKILGWLWAQVFDAKRRDITLPNPVESQEGKKEVMKTNLMRLLGNRGQLDLVKMNDEQVQVKRPLLIEGKPQPGEMTTNTIYEGSPFTLQAGDIICLKDVNYRYQRPGT